jgi:hypothetical protein
MSDFLLNLHRSIAHRAIAKILDIPAGMPAVFAIAPASRSRHIFSQKIAHLRFNIRSYLKKEILVQGQGGTEFQPAGILMYVEDLNRRPNAEIGLKDFFESASIQIPFFSSKESIGSYQSVLPCIKDRANQWYNGHPAE